MKKSGFTLVEIIVAMALFAGISIGMAGAVINVMEGNRKTNSLVEVVDNLGFALDSMTREIRVGNSYDCGDQGGVTDCPAGDDKIVFTTSEGLLFAYRLNTTDDSIERCGSALGSCPDPNTDADYQRMTGRNVEITNLEFTVRGTAPANDNEQPRMLILVSGQAGDDPDRDSAFTIQTTVTQRLPDI